MISTNSLILLFLYTLIIIAITYFITYYYNSHNKKKLTKNNQQELPYLIGKTSATENTEKRNLQEKKEKKLAQSITILETDQSILYLLNKQLTTDYLIYSFTKVTPFLNHLFSQSAGVIILDAPTENEANSIVDQIKKHRETSHIPILRLISKASNRINCQKFADLYLEKPFSIYELKKGIEGLLTYRKTPYAYTESEEISTEINADCLHCSNNIDWQFIEDVKQNIEENMQDSEFNVDTLCALLNMSRTSFYNKIKTLTGEAPSDYIRSFRIQKAANLLSEDQLNINEIALATGFSDAKYFREVFKKHYNMNPTEYKKEVKL